MPATEVKRRRGTAEQNNAFTGAEGEITVDLTNKNLRVHDGVTQGGTATAKESEIIVLQQKINELETKVDGVSGVKTGEFIIAGHSGPVDGALFCDGSRPLITNYQNLYNKIGTSWGKVHLYAYSDGIMTQYIQKADPSTGHFAVYANINGAIVPVSQNWFNMPRAEDKDIYNADLAWYTAWKESGMGVNDWYQIKLSPGGITQLNDMVYTIYQNGQTYELQEYGRIIAIDPNTSAITVEGHTDISYVRAEDWDSAWPFADGSFPLPNSLDRSFWGANVLGYLAEQLPNIVGDTGRIYLSQYQSGISSGALFQYEIPNGQGNAGVRISTTGIRFDASQSSPVYTDNGVVRPNSLGVRIFIKY